MIRATVVYFLVTILLRAMGRRELSEMSAFELVLLIMIGDLVQQAVTGEDYSVIGALLAIGTIGFWILLTSYVTFRFAGARGLLEGKPVVVISEGRLQHAALRTIRVTVAEVADAAREQGIDDLRKVRLGVLEAGGKFSFLRADGQGEQQKGQRQHRAR